MAVPGCLIRAACLTAILGLALPGWSSGAAPSSLVDSGAVLLQQGRFTEAAALYAALLAKSSDDDPRDQFTYNQGRALYHAGNLTDALTAFYLVISDHPESSLRPYAHYFAAVIQQLSGQQSRARDNYADALARSADARLTRLASSGLAALLVRNQELSIQSLQTLASSNRCQVASEWIRQGGIRESDSLAARVKTLCGRVSFAKTVTPSAVGELHLAFVLPQSGEYGEFGTEIYRGAVIAAEQARRTAKLPIKVTLYETEGDPVLAGLSVWEAAKADADIIIGPLTSEECAAAASATALDSIAMIIPAATRSGLSRLGPRVFQLTAPLELQGDLLAEYAINVLKADTAAILAPPDFESQRESEAFAARFASLGGTVLTTETYRLRDRDFGAYLRALKAAIWRPANDTAVFLNDRGDTVEFEATPVSLDCLFVPGRADQLRQVLPQIAYYNIKTTLLGTDGWGDESVYSLRENVTSQAVFASPFLGLDSVRLRNEIESAYRRQFNAAPGRLAALGYDAVQFVVEHRNRLSAAPPEIERWPRWSGIAGPVQFTPQRENRSIGLYRIVDKRPVRVELP